MRSHLKRLGLVVVVVSCVYGTAQARTPDYPSTPYSNSTEGAAVLSEGGSVDRSVKTASAQSDREMASLARDMQPRRESISTRVFKIMERAQASRDAGDMKNACRLATQAFNIVNRRSVDPNSQLYVEIAAQQAEFCSTTA